MESQRRTAAFLGDSWSDIFAKDFAKPYMRNIGKKVAKLRKLTTVYPAQENVFRAFKETPYPDVRVVIIGQDPYYNGQADGLAFSSKDIEIPASLQNIFKEIEDDLKITTYDSPNLARWATQGVFLLNTHLTVTAGQPLSHHGLGWDRFTGRALKILSLAPVPTVFMLWGSAAKGRRHLIDERNHLILEASHPSPRSSDGFFGCKHFSKCNKFLINNNLKPINWS